MDYRLGSLFGGALNMFAVLHSVACVFAAARMDRVYIRVLSVPFERSSCLPHDP